MGILAVTGGPKTYDAEINMPWPVSNPHDLNGLLTVLDQKVQGKNGPIAKRFEERFAVYNDVKHCILCANGTVSLELILRGLEIGRGDEVIISPYTFIATVSSIVYAGATPVFADIEPGTCNLSADSVREKITPRTKAIIPVYIGGRPADLDALTDLADETGLYLIGDAAQAAGSQWRGRGVGSYGIAASFSCQNTKNLTCGEGGIITTNDNNLAKNIRAALNGGMGIDGKYRFVGVNHNISEWQASILDTQMDNLDAQIARRMESAAYLDSLLADIPCVSPPDRDERITKNSYHLYVFRVHEDQLDGVSRKQFIQALEAEMGGYGFIDSGYAPLYTFPCLSGRYVKNVIGGTINLNPGTDTAEQVSHHEALWLGHRTLLNDKRTLEYIADGITKVYENLDELRGNDLNGK